MTTASVFTPPAVAALMARAGASDQDRAAWLAERLAGLTATEVAGLAVGKKRQGELVDLKLGLKEDTFNGNAYTEWGKLREPFLASAAERRGILPESRVFHHAENRRWLASPDGVGTNFDGELQLGEYKTSGHDLTPGTPTFDRTGYLEQMTWAMLVAGARRCLFIWEERLGTPETGFEAGRQYEYWIEFDEALAKRLVTIAKRFFTALDKKRAEVEAGNVTAPVVDPVLDVLAIDVLAGRREEAAGKRKKETAWKQLQAELADRDELSQRSSAAQVTWVPGVESTVPTRFVDSVGAQKAHPVAWAAVEAARAQLAEVESYWAECLADFTTTTDQPVTSKPSLTVTEVKTKGDAA
ncbi:YqaJ viral recombinase family protein [Microbacterium testaceum]|uniref:YqaJ viral recombinase family protein n=1 Tax=Microbacterium testaceum TaxID=2033 RepID=UPI000734C85A|nr:YqaJ viral recombinase family protein [Microbacterium testaceum]